MKYSASFKKEMMNDCTNISYIKLSNISNDEIIMETNNMNDILNLKGKNQITVSSLEFWGPFIVSFLFNNGWKTDEENKNLKNKYTFNTLINDQGDWYRISAKGKNGTIIFENFVKKIGTDTETFGKDMNIENDENKIINYAIRLLDNNKLDSLTIGSACLKEFKRMGFCHSSLCKICDEEEKFIRESYKGGLCGTGERKEYEGLITVLDMNSMYPYVLCKYRYPSGAGTYVKGKCKGECYIQRLTVTLKLKKDKIPCLVEKNMFFDVEPIYYTRTTLTLTNVDIENMYENYEVDNIVYIDGYEYKTTKGNFTGYILKWYDEKMKAKQEGNHSKYYLAKLMLNNLGGKLGTKRTFNKNMISMDDKGNLVNNIVKIPSEDWYLPAACFMTAYARKELIEMHNKLGKELLYYDTDSLHLIGEVTDERIDDLKLGYWKIEGIFNKGIYYKQKTYGERDLNNKWKYTVAGCPYDAKQQITEDNFKEGTTIQTKVTKRIKGGCTYTNITFTI